MLAAFLICLAVMLAGYVSETLRIGRAGTTPVMLDGWKPWTNRRYTHYGTPEVR
jgi:hypothetical protein